MKYLLAIVLLGIACLSCSKSYKGEKPSTEIATVNSVTCHKISADTISVEVEITVKDTTLKALELHSGTGYLVGKVTNPRTGHYTIAGAGWPSPVKAPYNFTLIVPWGKYELSTFYLEY